MLLVDKEFIIPAELNAYRLDQALAQLCTQYSRSQWQHWIRQGDVQVDHQCIQQPRYKVYAQQTISVQATWQERECWVAQALPLNIVYADEDLLVLNKAAGMVVHPGAGNPDQTLINALLNFDSHLAHLPRAGLIHRLDKDTSGLLLIARNLNSYHQLVHALQQREVERIYQAIVQGILVSGGTINLPIGRHPQQRIKMSIRHTGGKPAVTHYRILHRFRQCTHVRVQLETGRTHQIRVHFAHIRHPLIGDPTYGRKLSSTPSSYPSPIYQQLQQFPRQALHACELSIQHPRTGELMRWQAPLPTDMQILLDSLMADAQLIRP